MRKGYSTRGIGWMLYAVVYPSLFIGNVNRFEVGLYLVPWMFFSC